MQTRTNHPGRRASLIFAAVALIGPAGPARAQEPDGGPGRAPDRVELLEGRLREMEATNRRLTERLDAAEARHERQINELVEQIKRGRGDAAESPPGAEPEGSGGGTATAPAGAAADAAVPNSGISGSGAPERSRLKVEFGPGFELISDDGEFQLQFHQETQLDARSFDPHGDEFARSGLVFPRVRAFFNGRITKPIEYTFSINRGFSGLDVLDANLNFHYDDRLQFKAGRFMTPFNYEQFAIQNMWLFAPERSLFTANLGLNRQLGLQFWGNVLDKRVDYAVGLFDGPRNSFEDYNEAKDVMAYLNARPFGRWEEGAFLRDLNLGGSYAYGAQDNPLVPRAFRSASNASNASAADLFSPPFLILNESVRERGQRTFWSAHLAHYYKQFSFFTDYNGGSVRYAPSRRAIDSVDVPVSGYSVAMGYFLTGETQERRTIVEPLRPFRLGSGRFSPGAWELIFRYSTIDFDRSVFTGGLADPDLWSNRAWITNFGLNWYLNRYVKVYLDWQHTEFGDPVIYIRQPERKQLTNELFWVRLQLYF